MTQPWTRGPVVAALLVTLGLSLPAHANPDVEPTSVDRFAYLRQLSLDLWGRVPTYDELEQLSGQDDVTATHVDAMLDDDRFAAFVNRYHADLLLPFLDPFKLINFAASFLAPPAFADPLDTDTRLFTYYTALYTRGAIVPCADEPAQFNPDGSPVLTDRGDGILLDGYVMVEPYWAPGTQVKVCALEARTAAANAAGQDCTQYGGMASGTCGCGPNLERCQSVESSAMIRDALVDQMLNMLRTPIAEGRSYFDALVGNTELVNGPIVHYYKHHAPLLVDPFFVYPPVALAQLPDVPFDDTTWREVTRVTPAHSGLLTSMSYLLRFQTARARASRFWDVFLCTPFQAPDAELPSPDEPCSDEPDLRLRCGCNGCHAQLEPAAAYWSRFVDAGTAYLDPVQFPVQQPACGACGADVLCNFVCDRFYLTQPGHPKEEAWVNTLQQYVFRNEAEMANAEAGPSALVEQYLQSGQLAMCTATRLWTRLHNRPPTGRERLDLVRPLAEAFTASGNDFKKLVRDIITSDSYRRLAQ